ncbi:hypothetical protein WH47_11233 [Habropoda laboriosa]|uniref:Uncharacterized protein n=1 Tax=Habropoda laboriosa TaxID=597456 RepID=A0A0L7QKK5_9HYME|nr:PREDICTED: uncharacterized protein LOC108577862 [Habropoda laboriosa]KOC59157.1 hypothetical protein WH47_11233 [Habropoda laboriosa]
MIAKKDDGKGFRVTLVLGLLYITISHVSSFESANSTASITDGTRQSIEGRTGEENLPSTRSGPFTRTKDSYLEALRHSRTSTDPREGIIAVDAPNNAGSFQRRKEQEQQGPVYAANERSEISTASSRISYAPQDRDSFSTVPSDSYSLPSRPSGDFASGKNTYGPPPRGSYGAPYNDYSAYGDYASAGGSYPSSQQAYGPATAGYGVPYGHGVPHGMPEPVPVHLGFPSVDFSWPFALKLNAFTLAKILLKLVIFKMIVKFIAVICLLLFIPKLEMKKKGNKGGTNNDDEDEDEGRGTIDGKFLPTGESRAWERLNLLTAVVNDALKEHGRSNCSTLECRVRRDFAREQAWPDYEQLLQSYVAEETRRSRAKSQLSPVE